jgi:glycosyltransferase involved in cell wall biosynthesis
MSPDVSLIMPAFRPRADWLRDAVRSALDERACEIELIVVDDGSDEPVESLLAEVDDVRLRVVRVEHGGPYAARNAGIDAAEGEFLRFVDADDIVQSGSTGRLHALAAPADEAISYGATLICDEVLAPQGEFASELEGWVAEDCVLGRFEVYVVSMLFPRGVVERAGPWPLDFAVSGDWDFVLRAVEQAPVRCLHSVVTRYRRHAASITKVADVAAGAEAGRLVLRRYFARHPEQRRTDLERRAYVRLHLDRARAHAWRREPRAAAREVASAVRRSPTAVLTSAVRSLRGPRIG